MLSWPYMSVHMAERLTVPCVLDIHSSMKCASTHSWWACLVHPSQGHLSIQLLWADLHRHSICIFLDDAAVCTFGGGSVAATVILSYFLFVISQCSHVNPMWGKGNLTCIQYDPDFCHLQESLSEQFTSYLHSPQASMTHFIGSVAWLTHSSATVIINNNPKLINFSVSLKTNELH